MHLPGAQRLSALSVTSPTLRTLDVSSCPALQASAPSPPGACRACWAGMQATRGAWQSMDAKSRHPISKAGWMHGIVFASPVLHAECGPSGLIGQAQGAAAAWAEATLGMLQVLQAPSTQLASLNVNKCVSLRQTDTGQGMGG